MRVVNSFIHSIGRRGSLFHELNYLNNAIDAGRAIHGTATQVAMPMPSQACNWGVGDDSGDDAGAQLERILLN